MFVVAQASTVPDRVRERIIARLRVLERNPTWFARQLGKSKQWASDFSLGRGALRLDDVPKALRALDWQHADLYDDTPVDAVNTDTRRTDKANAFDTLPVSGGLIGMLSVDEQILVACFRKLPRRKRDAIRNQLMGLAQREDEQEGHSSSTGRTMRRTS